MRKNIIICDLCGKEGDIEDGFGVFDAKYEVLKTYCGGEQLVGTKQELVDDICEECAEQLMKAIRGGISSLKKPGN